MLVVNLTKDNVQDRKRGLSEALAGEGGESPKIEIVGVLEDHGQSINAVKMSAKHWPIILIWLG